jgi:hypothetical protein
MKFKYLSKREESIAEKIVDAAFTVHKVLGPGLLERVYIELYYNLCGLVPLWLIFYFNFKRIISMFPATLLAAGDQ